METKENTHSRRIRQILNNIEGFIPAIRWNLKQWLPTSETSVQFVLNKEGFHGVVIVKESPINRDEFVVGFVDFRTNEPTTKIISVSELFDYVNEINVTGVGHRAPKCMVQPSEPKAWQLN